MADKKSKPPFYLIDTASPFYRPLPLRIIICLIAAFWAALEIYAGDTFWMVISGAAAVYCIYVLLISYRLPPAEPNHDLAEQSAEKDGAGGQDQD